MNCERLKDFYREHETAILVAGFSIFVVSMFAWMIVDTGNKEIDDAKYVT